MASITFQSESNLLVDAQDHDEPLSDDAYEAATDNEESNVSKFSSNDDADDGDAEKFLDAAADVASPDDAEKFDTTLAALYKTAHHDLYVAHMEGKCKPTATQAQNFFVEFCYNGLVTATSTLDVPKAFQELGYIDPTKAKLRAPFQFLPLVVPAGDAQPPKPKPKA